MSRAVERSVAAVSRLESPTYALLRVVAGLMFACHGAQKLFGAFGGKVAAVGSQLWAGALIELLGGPLIALGLFVRPAAFLAAGTMAVAYIQFHWKLDVAGNRWLPVINKGELAALYTFVFLFIFARGPGAWSLDRRRGRG
jgi:putative oxidoreductase